MSSWCDQNDCQDKVCAYSRSDNYVVASRCGSGGWNDQAFTFVSGSLGGAGRVGYMCADGGFSSGSRSGGLANCNSLVRVEGTTAAKIGTSSILLEVALNSGDAVFCSP